MPVSLNTCQVCCSVVVETIVVLRSNIIHRWGPLYWKPLSISVRKYECMKQNSEHTLIVKAIFFFSSMPRWAECCHEQELGGCQRLYHVRCLVSVQWVRKGHHPVRNPNHHLSLRQVPREGNHASFQENVWPCWSEIQVSFKENIWAFFIFWPWCILFIMHLYMHLYT